MDSYVKEVIKYEVKELNYDNNLIYIAEVLEYIIEILENLHLSETLLYREIEELINCSWSQNLSSSDKSLINYYCINQAVKKSLDNHESPFSAQAFNVTKASE